MSRRSHGWARELAAAALGGWLAAGLAASAATYPLKYRASGESESFSLPLEKSEVRFKKEPAYEGEVVRSLLAVAPGGGEFIGFACDLQAKKLYLDLNRNLDLTDDPGGMFESNGDNWGCSFEKVGIVVEQGGRRREMVINLTIYGSRWGRYEVRSSWAGKGIEMGGRTFRVAVVDDGDGVLTEKDAMFLDPGEVQGRKVSKNDRRVELHAPATLVLDGEPFALAYEWSDDGQTLALTVEPAASVKLEEVERTGEGVERIVMQDDGVAGLFWAPGNRIRMPAGRYRASVWTRVGDEKRTSLWAAWNVSQRVPAGGGGEVWRVGGPITSKLTCKKSVGRLQFDQATVGVGGEKYSLVNSSGVDMGKPKLRVKKNGQVVHVGEFEYG